MSALPIVEPAENRPAAHRGVPLLTEPSMGHYPEFRAFLARTFGLDADRIGGPGLLSVEGRFYELVLLGRSGTPFPSGVEIHALLPGLEPLDEDVADRDLWAVLEWLVDGVGGEWSAEDLVTTGRIYRVPAVSPAPAPPTAEAGPLPDSVAFDLYGTLVDPLAIAADLERAMPRAQAQRVAGVWRSTQLQYAFRLTMMHRYEDFARVTARALDFALLEAGGTLTPSDRATVLAAYDALEPFPDAAPALAALAGAGVRTAVLSNGTPSMLRACLDGSGLAAHVQQVISVDAVRAYKPHPAVYHHAAAATGRPIEEIHLVSCNPFDIVGAATVGMRTVWVNRSGVPFDTLGAQPDVTLASLADLPAVLGATAPAGRS